MGAVTYPNNEVVKFVNEQLIPVQLLHDAKPAAIDYNIKWTPSLLILDAKGKEHHRIVGFLPPEEVIPALMLGIAKLHFDFDENKEAIPILEKILATYPKSAVAPEAVYLHGVCLYKTTHDAKHLKEAHERIQREYPNSEWVNRSAPYQLLTA